MIDYFYANFIGFQFEFPLSIERIISLVTAFDLSLASILPLLSSFGCVSTMNDWAPPLIAAALFWLLSPGMIFQLPGKNAPFEFMNMKTTVASMFVHTVIYGLLLMLFFVVLSVHLYI
ncbi:unnamed protein product [Sphenostylis stenocarpa]|uniref:Uncharacterized protein n=3 Tax=Phaseoleae TaxID=163735 RepID=A0AA86V0X9_9FABA|nr:unnamed protein product [Sphenostylis stenocarpa]